MRPDYNVYTIFFSVKLYSRAKGAGGLRINKNDKTLTQALYMQAYRLEKHDADHDLRK